MSDDMDLEKWCLTQASAIDEDVRRHEEDFSKTHPSRPASLSETIGYAVGLLWGNAQAAAYREVARRVVLLRTEESYRRGRAAEAVDHPAHYNTRGVECVDVVERLPFCLGNCLKYLWRAGEKGDRIEDLRKALWYARRAAESPVRWFGTDAKRELIDAMEEVRTEDGEALRAVLVAVDAWVRGHESMEQTLRNVRAAIEQEIDRRLREKEGEAP